MFEISELKAKTLAELQVVAKSIGVSKISQLKKLDLVYQIIDTQAADPSKATKTLVTPKKEEAIKIEKPKRKRVIKNPQVIAGPVDAEKTEIIEEPTVETVKVEPIVTARPKPNPRPSKPLVKCLPVP
jgi:transcription termination factor Rho